MTVKLYAIGSLFSSSLIQPYRLQPRSDHDIDTPDSTHYG